MRLRHKPWAHEFLQEHPELVVTETEQVKKNWEKRFGNDQPIHLEVGTGKGKYLSDNSIKHPDINFIGMEMYESVLATGVQRALFKQPENLAFIHGDVRHLMEYFDPSSVETLYINFTDPWPKKRHEKRRLTHPDFLELYQQVLVPGGTIQMKTDNQGLFEYSLSSLSTFGFTLEKVRLHLHESEEAKENVMTEYEEKFYAKGEPIYFTEAVRP